MHTNKIKQIVTQSSVILHLLLPHTWSYDISVRLTTYVVNSTCRYLGQKPYTDVCYSRLAGTFVSCTGHYSVVGQKLDEFLYADTCNS